MHESPLVELGAEDLLSAVWLEGKILTSAVEGAAEVGHPMHEKPMVELGAEDLLLPFGWKEKSPLLPQKARQKWGTHSGAPID